MCAWGRPRKDIFGTTGTSSISQYCLVGSSLRLICEVPHWPENSPSGGAAAFWVPCSGLLTGQESCSKAQQGAFVVFVFHCGDFSVADLCLLQLWG